MAKSWQSYNVLGVRLDAVSIPEAIDYIMKRSLPGQTAGYVVKPYAEFLDRATSDLAIIRLLNNAELSLSDGVAGAWASSYLYGGKPSLIRWLGSDIQLLIRPKAAFKLIPERIGGINFTWPLLQAAATHQRSVFLIGSPKHQTISATGQHLTKSIAGLNIVGTYGGHFPPGDRQELLAELKKVKPDIILVGIGFPRQEELMAWLVGELKHGILIGEGGTFDYPQFGGRRSKAPNIFQRLNLEWLWRLLLEPGRFKRQLAIPRLMWKVYLQGRSHL